MKHAINNCKKICIYIILYSSMILLNGCDNLILMNPKGQIGLEERSLILIAFCLMLIVIIPVIVMTIIFSIKYRSSNNNKKYDPNWSESKPIEFIIWFVPIVIILILGILTWNSTHKLDPKKTIKTSVSDKKTPIIINVIALDWKWLFIYPKYNIAVINEIVFPVDTPIHFNITSNTVMNSFFIPQLGSQVYAMAGMCSQLKLISHEPGIYKGISSNFSGAGFSGMKFTVITTKNEKEFINWIRIAQNSIYHIKNVQDYLKLSQPSKFNSVIYFSHVKCTLFDEVINKFIDQNKKHNYHFQNNN